MHAAQRVAVALHGVEIVAQQLLARRVGQALPDRGRRLGEGTAEAQMVLVAAGRVDHQARQVPMAVAFGLRQRPFRKAQVGVARAQDEACQAHSVATGESARRARGGARAPHFDQ